MKNRIETKFLELKNLNKKFFACFLTSGDPTNKIFENLLLLLPKLGSNLIEIGLPFSDPMADGPTIQRSSQRAIKSGINIKKTLNTIRKFREHDSSTPIVLMGYFNPIYQFGLKDFFYKSNKSGVDGLIIVDLPPEEDSLIKNLSEEYNIHNIRLIAPTTSKERIKKISKSSRGFLYYVSVMGITGTKKPSINEVKKSVDSIKKISNLPVLVGFGINSYDQITKINKFADGCVVGSAIIKIIEEAIEKKEQEKKILEKVANFLLKLNRG
jgi:tryptophan synthase alpha chain